VLINTFGTPPSIAMAPGGETITERIPQLLMNYDGAAPVTPNFYRDVVAVCARACLEPVANIREMRRFAKGYEERWIDSYWLPK